MLEAERLAAGNDWRGGVNRFRVLLEEWKSLPRLDRATDDALWHRFSSARTTYTRRRKAQFAQQNEQREAARLIKERLVTEAEALAGSTDWGPTTGAFRDLMARWKAAGPAPRDVEELFDSAKHKIGSSWPSSRPCRGSTPNSGSTLKPRKTAGRGRGAAADR